MNRDVRLVAFALFLWGFGEGLFFHIQPLYIEQLGATPVQIGGLLSVANVMRAATYLPAGLLADRLPRKWLMVGGWLTGFVGVLLVGLARSWQGLIPGLLVYALSAYCLPVINTYLAHAVGGRSLARAFTTVFAGFAAGGIISPAVGGWLAEVTTMRTVYFTSASLFVVSAIAVFQVSPQPAPRRPRGRARWDIVFSVPFARFAAFTTSVFTAMYLIFPLAPNFLQDVGGWRVTRIGMLGSFQAMGTALLSPLLGRLSDGEKTGRDDASEDIGARAGGFFLGVGLVWSSALMLVAARGFPLLAGAYLLRGSYQGCRSLTQARATGLAGEADRGLVLGATETLIAAAQVVAPYLAGWLYTGGPTYPFLSSIALIPVILFLGIIASRR